MILDIYKLFQQFKYSNSTPTEDFNTEIFAGILNFYPKIKNELVENLFKLPVDSYLIKTQLKKTLDNDTNCVIDLVFEGNDNICFIENKVNSHEGYRQLERYSIVLEKYYPQKKHFLYYCTKNSDPKNLKGEYNKFNFKQFRWYEIAKKLRPFSPENPLVKNYLTFLDQQQMAQDNTLRIENLLSLKNLSKSLEIIEFLVDNSIEDFKEKFSPSLRSKSRLIDQIKRHNRVCVYHEKPLVDSNNSWSEILYGINLENLNIFIQFFVSQNHEQYSKFREEAIRQTNFSIEESEYGIALIIKQDLGIYLNNDNSDIEIKNWLKKRFKDCENFILNTTDLKWNINSIQQRI